MKKLLVVGGTGFIGYHIIKEAKKRKWKITSISLNKPKNVRFHKNVNYIKVNFSDFKKLKNKLNGNYDFVVNAGGYGVHPNSDNSGKKLFNSHFLGTVNLVKILSKKKIKKFIQIGSSAEYGRAKHPQVENSKCFPKTPYALTKFACSNFLQNFNQINNFPVTILRFFLVYGPKQDKNRILPQIIEKSLNNKSFPTTNGQQYCDFCFIDDAVRAIFKTFFSSKTSGEIINVGLGKPIKIKKVITMTIKYIGKGKALFGKLKYKKDTNMRLYPNIQKAKKLIKWKPKIKFAQGLKLTISSYK
ncbi:MAG: hypothetical protein CMI79_03260 [Candidatus Pelagibacter sp.]|nr:hypothetical protein [Candidatus Pelagibacter sp.]|tara:strand:- start:1568 stop:2470 length:903 start_codon:yes stop_codon:yes gene_type:complete